MGNWFQTLSEKAVLHDKLPNFLFLLIFFPSKSYSLLFTARQFDE